MYRVFTNHCTRGPIKISTPLQGRPYCSTTPPLTENFVYCDVKYQNTVQIKQRRLGTLLENFKNHYEKPIFDIFETIRNTRRQLGNKRAKKFIQKPLTPQKREILAKRLKKKIWLTSINKADEKYHDDLIRVQTDPGNTKAGFEYKKSFFNTPYAPDTLPTDPSVFLADLPPRQVEFTKGLVGKFEWERKLDDPNLVERILKDLREYKFPFDESDWSKRKNKVLGKSTHKNTIIDKMLSIGEHRSKTPITIRDRPAVVIPIKKPPKRNVRPKIQKVSEQYPLAFEVNTYPQTSKYQYSLYHTRKAILYVSVPALELTPPVRKRLIAIASYRNLFDHGKQLLVLNSSIKRTYPGNRRHVIRQLQKLLTEAWKADLNYLPPPDKLEPHEEVERELSTKEKGDKEVWERSFQSICGVNHWTIFRFKVVPDPGELSNRWVEGKRNFENAMRVLKELENKV